MSGELKFVHIGFGYVVCANRILYVIPVRTNQARRMMSKSKKEGKYIDMTGNKPARCIICLESEEVIGSAFGSRTIHRRLAARQDDDRSYSLRDKEDDEVEG